MNQTDLDRIARRALTDVGIDATPRPPSPLVAHARADLLAFGGYVWAKFQAPRHVEYVAGVLQQVVRYLETGGREGIGRVILELPVRHGKSTLAARLLPAFVLGKLPDTRVIVACHNDDLAERHGRWIRNLIAAERFKRLFPYVALAADSRARALWDLAEPHEGGLVAMGKNAAIVGHGGNLIIADDLMRGRREAESQLARDTTWFWLQDDLFTRAEPGAAIVMMSTRWHTDDPHGRLQALEGDNWHVVRLPALAEPDDPLGRAVGAALWPERHSARTLEARALSMGDYSFSALYQQRPIPAAGGLFGRADGKPSIIDHAPADIVASARFWDLAMSEKTSADYTVGVLLGKTSGGRIVVLDVARRRIEWDGVPDFVADTAQGDSSAVPVGIEEVAFMSRAVTDLLKRDALARYSIAGYKPDRDKVTRALPFAARWNGGMVDVLRRSWTEAYISELCSFDKGAHDDQVDASSGAYLMLSDYVDPALFEMGALWIAEDYHYGSGDF